VHQPVHTGLHEALLGEFLDRRRQDFPLLGLIQIIESFGNRHIRPFAQKHTSGQQSDQVVILGPVPAVCQCRHAGFAKQPASGYKERRWNSATVGQCPVLVVCQGRADREESVYLLTVSYRNTTQNGTGSLVLHDRQDPPGLPKWNLFECGPARLEQLRLCVVAANSAAFWAWFPHDLARLHGNPVLPMGVEYLAAWHCPQDTSTSPLQLFVGGLQQRSAELPKPLKKQDLGGTIGRLRNICSRARLRHGFLLAYGSRWKVHAGTDDFDFMDSWTRRRRFHSLFSATARLTDPSAFLRNLHRRATYRRFGPRHILDRLRGLLQDHFSVDKSAWHEKDRWAALPPEARVLLIPALDAGRHLLDAFPKSPAPLDQPGVILFDRPACRVGGLGLSTWMTFWDQWLPNFQFIVNLAPRIARTAPPALLRERLRLDLAKAPPRSRPIRLRTVDILLIDVDSRLPNLALMKLSRHFKNQGRKVTLARGTALLRSAAEVYASAVFHNDHTRRKIETLKRHYGDKLNLGGSGVDLYQRLPAEIEGLPSDYDLYPNLGDRAIGFLTRGCPRHCAFCIVPKKEGSPRLVGDLDDLLQGGRGNKLILLDDNLLAAPGAESLLEQMASRRIQVNFTQTLDIRLVDRKRADLLKRIHCSNTRFTRRNYHFSLNDCSGLDLVLEKYGLFDFRASDNVEFICMYGYRTTLAEDLERFRFLRSLPGAYVFVQCYQPIPNGPEPSMDGFFDGAVDRLIDELVTVQFTQNMKSMEKYYRWLSRLYAERFGRLHRQLVDTIFRYNNRPGKGRYIETLAGTIRGRVRDER